MASEKSSGESGASTASSQGVAALLRASRLRHGEDIKDIARALRIRLVYLTALEEGRWDELPGTTYAVGFLRAYSEYLGLDSVEMVRRFRTECEEAQQKTKLQFPAPVAERSVPGGAVLLISAILAAVAYGGWYMLADRDRGKVETVPPLPDRLAQMVGKPSGKAPTPAVPAEAPAPEAVKPADAPASAPSVQEPAKPADATSAAAPAPTSVPKPMDPAPLPIQPAPSALSESAPPPEPVSGMAGMGGMSGMAASPPVISTKVHVLGDGPSRITLKAKQDSWIQVRDEAAGKTIVTRLLRAGESFKVPDQPKLSLTTGNAGALDIAVDGDIVPTVGAVGTVKRGIALDPERLREGKTSGE